MGSKIEPGDELQQTSVIDLILGDGSGNLNRNAEIDPEVDMDMEDIGRNDNDGEN
jgi:hypothetical protein